MRGRAAWGGSRPPRPPGSRRGSLPARELQPRAHAPPRVRAPTCRVRNWLYSKWISRHTYKIHVVVAGLVTLVMSVACILFGLGLVLVVFQLAVQLACAAVDSVAINGNPISEVCINLPYNDGAAGWGCASACRRGTRERLMPALPLLQCPCAAGTSSTCAMM